MIDWCSILIKKGVLHEGQAGFGVNRSCIDNVCTLNKINYARQIEGR